MPYAIAVFFDKRAELLVILVIRFYFQECLKIWQPKIRKIPPYVKLKTLNFVFPSNIECIHKYGMARFESAPKTEALVLGFNGFEHDGTPKGRGFPPLA